MPGKPMAYKTTDEFLKMFGYSSLKDLPELPKYKLDSNQQIVIDDLVENEETKTHSKQEAPMPEREDEEFENRNQLK